VCREAAVEQIHYPIEGECSGVLRLNVVKSNTLHCNSMLLLLLLLLLVQR
jgi:hypothetical protein